MAIDPRIAMGFQMPEQPSRLGMAANALQLKNMLMQGQMQEAEMAAKRSELERQTGIRNFLQTNDVNTPEGMAAFRKAYPMEAPKIEAQMLEPQIKRAGLEKDQAQAKKYGTDAQAAEFKLKQDKVNQNLQLLANVQTPEQAAQWVSAGVTQGLISMEQAQAEISKIPRDPQGLAQWKQGQQAAGMTISQQMEQMWKAKDFGLRQDQFKETQRHNKATEGIAYGNLGIARENLGISKEKLSLDKDKAKKDEGGKVKDANEAISLLDMADDIVDKATGSLGGAWWDKTMGAVGKATEGGKAAAQLKALEGMLVSKMPKMSGPQSDKDVLLYRQMAAQIGDETIPREQKKAALATVRAIQEKYAGVPAGSTGKRQQGGGASGGWGGAPSAPGIKFLGFE